MVLFRSSVRFGSASDRGAPGKNERLYEYRHGAGSLEQPADVDEVEFPENDAVDRHDRIGQPGLLQAMNPDQAADVAVADEDERQAAVERFREAGGNATAEAVESREGGGFSPAVAERHGPLAFVQIEAPQGRLHRAP